MKKLNQSYNLFPVYETVEVMHIVVKSGTLTIGRDKQDRVIIKGDDRIIKLINSNYNKDSKNPIHECHIGFFDDREFIFPKGYTFNVSEADNKGTMVAFHVYKKELTGFKGQMVDKDSDAPWYPNYIKEEVDGNTILNVMPFENN